MRPSLTTPPLGHPSRLGNIAGGFLADLDDGLDGNRQDIFQAVDVDLGDGRHPGFQPLDGSSMVMIVW